MGMTNEDVILEPILTEKTNLLREGETKKYAFRVHPRANKNQVLDAVEGLFSVRPKECNIMNVKGKPRASRTRSGFKKGSTSNWKKAIVTMPTGKSLEIFEGA
jgi:large subunit ribosomal protein L23